MSGYSRRFVIGGVIAGCASQAFANAPSRSLRPRARPAALVRAGAKGATAPLAADLIAEARLGGKVSFVIADAKSGAVLEDERGSLPMPPASTAKIVTSLYAMEMLGPGYRFPTRLIATGPVASGRIAGNLVLAGGGDPVLSTDTLGDMALELARGGVKGVTGEFQVWGGALPYLAEIDRGQPDYLGYNPAVSGLNLNFNRVNFVWKRAGADYEVGMDARAERFAPPVYSARISIVDRDLPVYTYQKGGRYEDWTVARSALGKGGSRWLPVRRPDLYAGDVFQTLARAAGIPLPGVGVAASLPKGRVLVERQSDALRTLLTEMMRYSTNMTAEAVGMAASLTRGANSHVASGREMSRWLNERASVTSARLVDHSGLGGASRISAADMVAILVRLGPGAELRDMMKDYSFRDDAGRKLKTQPIHVNAKTGTLNFVSALAGYMTTPGGRELAFAIFTGDVARRDAVPATQRERPEGGKAWVSRARHLQQQLVERWAVVHDA